MVVHRMHECEVCFETKKEKQCGKLHGHWICRKCLRRQNSMKAIVQANKEVWKERKAKGYKSTRRNITWDERRVLYLQMIRKGMDEEAVKLRLKNLQGNLKFSSKIFREVEKETKPTFKEEFEKLTKKNVKE
jgi:hypothetical protein